MELGETIEASARREVCVGCACRPACLPAWVGEEGTARNSGSVVNIQLTPPGPPSPPCLPALLGLLGPHHMPASLPAFPALPPSRPRPRPPAPAPPRLQLLEEAQVRATAMEHCGLLRFVFDDKEQPWEVHGGWAQRGWQRRAG